jgi:diadenosine tetraphosphate (Ap4A) HIT family hydrolase
MSREIKPTCPFDWEDGKNDKLKGGELLGLTDNRFSYAFFGPDDRFTNGLIALVRHGEDIPALLTVHSTEMAHHLRLMLHRMGDVDGYNVYANEGGPAGMTVGEHAHLHVLRRDAGDSASRMGLGKLVIEYNKLFRSMWSGGT